MKGPNRRQILVSFEGNVPDVNLIHLVEDVNRGLASDRFGVRVLSANRAYQGFTLATSTVPTPAEVDLVRAWIFHSIPDADDLKAWVGLPTSTSYLKIVDVPYFVDNFTKVPTKPEEVRRDMESSPLSEHFTLTGPPRVVRNSPASTTAMVFFNVWDSQTGARARKLMNNTILIRGVTCQIRTARANPGLSLCTRCWRWGHSSGGCRAIQPKCPRCSGPHREEQHRDLASCCRGNPKATPPVPPTPAGQPCPHRPHCPNCKGAHSATERSCSFWIHRFDHKWIEAKYAQVRDSRPRRGTPPNIPRS